MLGIGEVGQFVRLLVSEHLGRLGGGSLRPRAEMLDAIGAMAGLRTRVGS